MMIKDIHDIKAGMKVEVIADTNSFDPHELPIGTVATVKFITPPVLVEEMTPFVRFCFKVEGIKPKDLDSRIHVEIEGTDIVTNLEFADVKVLGQAKEGYFIRMKTDDVADGYAKGNVFELKIAFYEGEFVLGFYDNDEDFRPLDSHLYEIVNK